MEPIDVYLCDDVPELRALVRVAFEDDPLLRIVGEAGDARVAVEEIVALRPDVVLLDLSMPGLDGLEALPMICERSPATAVIVFSGFAAARMQAAALHMGAMRYLEKGTSMDVVLRAVREVAGRPPVGG